MDAGRVGAAALVGHLSGQVDYLRAEGAVAGARACFDERLPLPVRPLAGIRLPGVRRAVAGEAVVTREGVEADDEQSVAPRRAQSRVELVARTISVGRAHERKDAL